MKQEVSLRFATKFFDRMAGLFSCQNKRVLLVISPCCSVHTFFLKQAINVAFFDKDGRVIASYTKVKPFKILKQRGAYGVVESWSNASCVPALKAQTASNSTVTDEWFKRGDVLRL